jgi:esterase/lipase superfamily enzyme
MEVNMRSPWTLNGRQDRLWRASNPEKQGTAMAALSVYVLNTIVTICCQLLVITCSALGAYKSSIAFFRIQRLLRYIPFDTIYTNSILIT